MEFRRSSPFFSRLALRQGNQDLQERLLARRRRRRVVGLVAVVAFLTVTVAGSIYLATPHRPGQWRPWHRGPARPHVATTTMTTEPGTVDLQIRQPGKSQTYRFRKVGEDLVIQDVTPGKPQKARKR
jgi:hypothetical protein